MRVRDLVFPPFPNGMEIEVDGASTMVSVNYPFLQIPLSLKNLVETLLFLKQCSRSREEIIGYVYLARESGEAFRERGESLLLLV
jgi:hypothetical protein